MRGQGHFQRHRHAVQRITPADAGTSGTVPVTLTVTEDHPRGCGDKDKFSQEVLSKNGSPPRMRGQASWSSHRLTSMRITPADAGTREYCRICHLLCPDHPRGCGDKWHGTLDTVSRKGSPPRMRGQGSAFVVVTDDLSITPADAGTSEATTGKFDYS